MKFNATLKDWKWMKAAKSVRMFFELHELTSAVQMSPRIEENVCMRICHSHHPQIQAIIDPCHITDLQHKNKKYTLVCETCSESQKTIKDLLVPVVGDDFILEVGTAGESTAKPASVGTVSEASLKGLHATFFQNKKFWQFVADTGNMPFVDSAADCKIAYKDKMGVTSCKDLQQDAVNNSIKEFNDWLNRA